MTFSKECEQPVSMQAAHRTVQLRWPPASLGLGPPLNLASLAPEMRPALRQWMGVSPVLGVMIVLLVSGIDLLLFKGMTLQRAAHYGSQPVASRVLVSFYGSVLEELLFRVFVATLIAWLAYFVLSQFMAEPKLAAQWVGTLVAAAVMGLWWHLGGRYDSFTVARMLTENMVIGVAYGWLYWSKGLEVAMLTHTVVYLCLFFVVPAIR